MTAPYYQDDAVTLYHGDCREAAAWLHAEQQQRITALEAETRSLREQLHRKEDLLTRYRHIDEAADVLRQQHRGFYTDDDLFCTGCQVGTPYPCAVRRALDPEETL